MQAKHAEHVIAAVLKKDARPRPTTFSQLSTTCACGAPSAVYFFAPFRAYCGEHAPSQHDSDRA